MKVKLPKTFKKKWIAALRSGKYKQGGGALQTTTKHYCCLGVACRTVGIQDNLREFQVIGRSNDGKYIQGFKKIPRILRGSGRKNSTVDQLATMNDGPSGKGRRDRKTFTEIADWIEENL